MNSERINVELKHETHDADFEYKVTLAPTQNHLCCSDFTKNGRASLDPHL